MLIRILCCCLVSLCLTATGAEARTLYFPHYGDGSGLSMMVVINNLSDQRAIGTLRAFAADGSPQELPFASGTAAEVPFNLQAGGSVVLTTAGTSSPLKSGYLVLESDQPDVSGVAIFRFPGGAEASVLPVELGTRFALYVERSAVMDTGLAVARPVNSGPVTLSLLDAQGREMGRRDLPDLDHQAAKFLSELYALAGDFRGTMVLEAANPFAAVGLRFGAGLLSTIPLADLTPVPDAAVNTSLVSDPASLYIAKDSLSGYVRINGRIWNRDLSDATFVQVGLAAFDAGGNFVGGETAYLIGTNRKLSFSFTETCLLAGDSGYFSSYFTVTGDVASAAVFPIARISTTTAPAGRIEVLEHTLGKHSNNWLRISGKIKNTGTAPVRYVWVNVVPLDSSGRVLAVELGSPEKRELAPGEETTFVEDTTIPFGLVDSVDFRPEWSDVTE